MKKTIHPPNELDTTQEQNKHLVFQMNNNKLVKYTQLFYAVKNVENASRLFGYENLITFKEHKYFDVVSKFLKIMPLKRKLEQNPPRNNVELFVIIDYHLRSIWDEVWVLKEEQVVKEQLKDIWYLIHQAYQELDWSNLNPVEKCIKPEHEKFEEFLKFQTR